MTNQLNIVIPYIGHFLKVTLRQSNLLLSDPRVDPSNYFNFAIKTASENGHDFVVQLLLSDPRVDPSDNDNEAIREASKNGHDKVIQLPLTNPRVDPSAADNYAICEASEYGKLDPKTYAFNEALKFLK